MQVPTTVYSYEVPAIFQDISTIVPMTVWKRRGQGLEHLEHANPFLGPYFEDKYPIERSIYRALSYRSKTGRYPRVRGSKAARIYELYSFLNSIRYVYQQLSNSGKTRLRGRLQDGLKEPQGLLPLALEMSVGVHLSNANFDVDFVDLLGGGQYDISARRDELELEVECKASSGDVGRPIHRHRVLELFHRIKPMIDSRLNLAGGRIVHIILDTSLHSGETAMESVVKLAELGLRGHVPGSGVGGRRPARRSDRQESGGGGPVGGHRGDLG